MGSARKEFERVRTPAYFGSCNLKLANPRPEKATVALDAHFATVQKVSHRCNSFPGALRARANSQDQVAKGKLRARSEYKRILFHRYTVFDSNSGAIVQCEQAYRRGGKVISRLLIWPLGCELTLVLNSLTHYRHSDASFRSQQRKASTHYDQGVAPPQFSAIGNRSHVQSID